MVAPMGILKGVFSQGKAKDHPELAAAARLQNRWDGAGQGRRMAAWRAPSTGPNAAMSGDVQTLRNRASDSVRNDWISEAIVQKWATALVGIAITPRFGRITGKHAKQQVHDLWQDFIATCDADGVLDGYGLQTLAVRSWLERGEVFARRRWRNTGSAQFSALPVPMQIQLLEADMLPMLDADTWPGLAAGRVIRSGIEFDRRGQRMAYWFYKEHPGEQQTWTSGLTGAGAADLVRIAAADVIHMFEARRAGQRRGVPLLAPILAKLRNIADYEDATLERQRLANLFVAFIGSDLPDMDPTDPNAHPLTGKGVNLDSDLSPILPMRPGLIQELAPGQKIEFASPPNAGTHYSDYMRTSLLGVSAGAGVPYELATGDIANISDRALRVIVNEFRRLAEQRQWQIIIPQYCQKVVQWFAQSAQLAGKISDKQAQAVTRCDHAPHGWQYIHPVQDVQGKALEVRHGFRSRSDVIGQSGDDPDAVDFERAADLARERELGLLGGGGERETSKSSDKSGISQGGTDDGPSSAPPDSAGEKARAQEAGKA